MQSFDPVPKTLFIEGCLFDVIITTAGVTFNAGTEGNIFLSWIAPTELMLSVFILVNILVLVLCLDLPDMMGGRWGDRGHSIAVFLLSSHGLFRILCGFSWMGLHLM